MSAKRYSKVSRPVVRAEQFKYLDGIDGPRTCARAKALGLSTNGGTSKLWEIWTARGWQIVSHSWWIVWGQGFDGTDIAQHVFTNMQFEQQYVEVTTTGLSLARVES